jgi:hypothetical protein
MTEQKIYKHVPPMETEALTLNEIGDRLLEQVQQLRAEGRWNPPPFEELQQLFGGQILPE